MSLEPAADAIAAPNGPEGDSSHSNQTVQSSKLWEHPLQLNDVRTHSQQWSLAGDAGLLLTLQEFSQKIISRTHETEKLVEDLAHSTKGTACTVHNVFNEFLMLSNSQFIENRVYDEAVEQEPQPAEKDSAKVKTREELESEIVPRFSQAVDLGIKVLDDAFITVEIKAEEESDDDDEGESALPAGYVADPILELRDVYSHRPLPYLIGTAEFFHDEAVGLNQEDSDDEADVKKPEQESEESESSNSEEEETESESEYSDSSEEEMEKATNKKMPISSSEEESSDEGNLFGDKTQKKKEEIFVSDDSDEDEEDTDSVKSPQVKPKLDLQAELSAKLGLPQAAPAQQASAGTEDGAIEGESKSTEDTVSVASSVVSPGKEKKHRKGSKLRSDSNADKVSVSSARTDATTPTGKKEKKHRARTKTNDSMKKPKGHRKKQEVDEDEDLFAPKPKDDLFEDESPFGKKGGLFSTSSSLFDDDNSKGGDLFGDDGSREASPTNEHHDHHKKRHTEEVSEIKPRARTTSSGKKLPAGAVSIFGDGMLPTGATKKGKDESAASQPSSPIKDEPSKKAAPPFVKGLFDDDGDDDLFGSTKDTLAVATPPPRKKTLELFADDEDDLFSAPKIGKPTEKEKPKVPAGGVSVFSPPVPVTKGPSLSPSAPASKKETAPVAKVSLFDNDAEDDEDDLFSDVTVTKSTPVAKKPDNKAAASLFDDNDDDTEEDDIFSIKPTKPKTSAVAKATPPSLETTLLKGKDEPRPAVATDDKAKQEDKVQSKQSPSIQKPANKSSNAVSSLLDDDSDDDLFASGPADTKTKSNDAKDTKSKSLFGRADDGLFGEESDDLFAIKAEVVPAEAPVSSSPVATPSAAESNLPPLLSGEDRIDAIVSEGQPSDGRDRTESDRSTVDLHPDLEDEEPKRRRPVGGVSMFGGVDPLAARQKLKQRASSDAKESTKDNSESSPVEARPQAPEPTKQTTATPPPKSAKPTTTPKAKDIFDDDDDDLFAKLPSASPSKPAVSSKSKTLPVPSKKPSNEMSSGVSPSPKNAFAAAKLNFNPAAMLPGAVPPPRQDAVDGAASFDEPPKTNTLTTTTKGRARGTLQRRPPSRQARQKAVRQSMDESLFPTAAIDAALSSSGNVSPSSDFSDKAKKSATLPASTKAKKPIAAVDIFDDDDDDLFGTIAKDTPKKTANATPSNSVAKPQAAMPALDESDDIFSVQSTPTQSTVAADNTRTNDAKATSHAEATSSVERDPLFETATPTDDDALFKAGEKTSNDKSSASTAEPVVKETEDKAKDGTSPQPTTKKTPASDKKSSKASASKKTDVIDIFGDDTDDLFGSMPSTRKATPGSRKTDKKNPAALIEDDIFGDGGGTSIFDDVPSKPRGRAKATNRTAAMPDDDDDLFATPSPAKSSSKKLASQQATDKKSSKTTSKAKSTAASSIFDDDSPSVFDDPLNAFK